METVHLSCFESKHFRVNEAACDAFPDGIPNEKTPVKINTVSLVFSGKFYSFSAILQ
jgi:hypothetical protein